MRTSRRDYIETQPCRSVFIEAAQGIGDGFDFLNMDATWAEQYHYPEAPNPLVNFTGLTAVAEEQDQQITSLKTLHLEPFSS